MDQPAQEILKFHPVNGKTLRADFQGGELSSDFGTILLRETMLHSGLISKLSNAIDDKRHQSYIDHPLQDLLTQRVLQMACGYEDANDSNYLRKDPMFKLAVGRNPLSEEGHLASAPTYTRLGQSMTKKDIYKMAKALAEHFISSYELPPMAAIIDLDHTPTITHGGQQMNLFNAKYNDYCYLPLLIFEGLSGKLITAVLRPGKTPTGKENAAILKRVIQLIRRRWPKTYLLVRGDSHFAQPELMRVVQDDPHSDYVLGKGAGHKTALRPKAKELLDEARQALKVKTGLARLNNMPIPERLRLYGEAEYQAKSWKGLDTRIIYKAEVNQKGDNPRFIVTSIKEASPEVIYEELYCPRGQDENFIKHLKSDLSGDRLSDQGFLANHLRMFYACAAYVIHHELRTKALKGTELEKAQPSTVIAKLCKIAVKVVEYKDRIKLHLPRSCPFRGLLRHVTEVFYSMPPPRPG
ncbi:IS1380 family transposase [Endozoicomonas numazuensis]|uniref:Transposase n=1 Tax=Endozoicomonas numazuensis TaxID=1137799 RepID=A0A081ND86_9GAMM|nr:IS1380 family transposase [Endozoicomonas numazuensis]KEQ16409.1 transposase [Endozoicomonas numazuensis]KEQ17318.1 transposase [Endozoicomonas numazuensis]KEQ18163.1 transposase [Endozoicomonas numazuensis]